MQAIADSGLQTEVLEQMKETTTVCANDLVNGIKDQLVVIFICVGVSSLVAFFASRLVIQLRNSENRHVGKYILSFTLNLLTVGLVYFLIIISLVNEIPAIGLVFIFLGIFVLLLVLTLI
ncbi:MAG: hypothetical protein MJ223_03930 [Mycoplasmoidaceae bacterium]|nr:hypothetical protein [Mycoplasmoidaceae bacterium]